MYCKKCGTRYMAMNSGYCFVCAGPKRHRHSLYWEWHNGKYDKDENPVMNKCTNKPCKGFLDCIIFQAERVFIWPSSRLRLILLPPEKNRNLPLTFSEN